MDSSFTHKEQCPACGSKDNLARYDDGHGYCFGCGHREHADGESHVSAPKDEPTPVTSTGIIPGSYAELTRRGLTLATCKAWGYQVGEMYGQKVQLANYFNDAGEIVAQKVRFANKDFKITGDKNAMGLYGKHMCRGLKRNICVLTEGELDGITLSQVAAGQLCVLSLPNGAQAGKKAVLKDLKFLEEFDKVVLCFDMDAPGRAAALECVKLLSPGKGHICELPLKDANEMLMANRGGELYKAVLNAQQYKPAGIVSVSDVKGKVLEKKTIGLPWWDSRLTALTYGRRLGEIYMLGAGTGVGKSDFISQQIEYDLNTLKEKVGIFFLEQAPTETVTRIAGKAAGQLFHVPNAGWTEEQLVAEVDKLDNDRCSLYDHFGECDWESIAAGIRYLYHANGVQLFYIDHLTALAAAEDDERLGLERIMAEMGALVKEIPIAIHCISHLATPEGKPHEEGGRVMIRHFKGSRTIGFWSHFMFALERNQQAENIEDRHKTTFRVLKDRYTGQATGQTLTLGYEAATGRLIASANPSPFTPAGPSGPSDF